MTLDISGREIGLAHPVYFVADIAANHDGDFERAKDLIYLAAESGADAAKFQNFKAETIVSDRGFKSLGGNMSHQSKWDDDVFEIYARAALPLDWTEGLRETCDRAGIHYFTAPYDSQIVKALSNYVCAWKIGSGDITWHSHIEEIARDGKPVLLATGASTLEDVDSAVRLIKKYNDNLVLMQCNTNYTASLENYKYISLNVLSSYGARYPGTVLGLSDHTKGHATVLGAIALGARVIEKHFTDNNKRAGPDHQFSMTPSEWREMVDTANELTFSLGTDEKMIMENEMETVVVQRRALRVTQSIKRGEVIEESLVIPLRPCPRDAIPPYRLAEVVGRRMRRDIESGEYLCIDDLE